MSKRSDPRPPGNPDALYPIKRPADWHRFDQTPRRKPLSAPATNITDEPLRCLQVNASWWSHISGMIDVLAEDDAWLGTENEQTDAARAIVSALAEVRDCMIDCEQVEGCLETSATITGLQTSDSNLQSQIDNQQGTIEEIIESDNAGGDSSVYPPPPVLQTNESCGASHYIVSELRDYIVQIEGLPVSYSNVFDALEAFLSGNINIIFATLNSLIAGVFAPAYTTITPQYDALENQMKTYLHCQSNDKEDFEAWLRDDRLEPEIADFVESIALITWNRWVAVGSTDDSQDCSSLECGTFCYLFDFALSDEGFSINQSRGFFTATGIEGDSGTGSSAIQVDASRLFSSFTVTGVELTYDCNSRSTSDSIALVQLDTVDLLRVSIPAEGTDVTITATGFSVSGTNLRIYFDTGLSSMTFGQVTIKSLKIQGTGVSPTGSSNC